MPETNYPSENSRYRQADRLVHWIGLLLILFGGGILLVIAHGRLEWYMIVALVIYVLCALASNLASTAYHFLPWHHRRVLLRRIDHAAIYPSISGTFTPFFVHANTVWAQVLLVVCWGLTLLAVWNKITNPTIKSKWSTASYLGLGAIGLCALPDLHNVPIATLWCIVAGAGFYVVGTVFYANKELPYRYAIWHLFVNFGGIAMFAGIWIGVV